MLIEGTISMSLASEKTAAQQMEAAGATLTPNGSALNQRSQRHLIVVIHESEESARQLKELNEFMDASRVLMATPDNWQEGVAAPRLAALFVSAGLSKTVQTRIFDGVAAIDCNVPLVLVGDDPQQADKAAPWAR